MVDLQPGGDAATTVWTTSPAVPSPADCQQATAAGVQIIPPGQTAAVLVRIAIPICTGPASNVVGVTAMVSGSAGSPM